jgi:hypothetical protein
MEPTPYYILVLYLLTGPNYAPAITTVPTPMIYERCVEAAKQVQKDTRMHAYCVRIQ